MKTDKHMAYKHTYSPVGLCIYILTTSLSYVSVKHRGRSFWSDVNGRGRQHLVLHTVRPLGQLTSQLGKPSVGIPAAAGEMAADSVSSHHSHDPRYHVTDELRVSAVNLLKPQGSRRRRPRAGLRQLCVSRRSGQDAAPATAARRPYTCGEEGVPHHTETIQLLGCAYMITKHTVSQTVRRGRERTCNVLYERNHGSKCLLRVKATQTSRSMPTFCMSPNIVISGSGHHYLRRTNRNNIISNH